MRGKLLRHGWMWLVLAALAVPLLSAGCFAPVDEDADVYVRGRVLDVDGTPLAGQTVELYKSNTPFWLFTDWLEFILESQGNTFRTTTTGDDGRYEFYMKGADVNTSSGNYAAYFIVAVFHDADRQMAVVTEDHHFSNSDLVWAVNEMQYWDIGEVSVDTDLYMDFTWPDLPKNPVEDFLFYVNDGDWAEWVTDSATALVDLPVEVLNPDTPECTWQMIAWSTGLRYRSSLKTFTNENLFTPIGATAYDGDGNELAGVTDREYTDRVYFNETTDPRTVILELDAPSEVTAFVIHNAWIFNFWNGGVARISTSLDGIDYQAWDSVSGAHDQWGLFYHHVIDPVGRDCQYIKIELDGPQDVSFDYIGELVAFGTPLP